MSVVDPSSDFWQAWQSARQQNDTGLLAALVLDNYDNETIPEWLVSEVEDVCGIIASDLDANLDRRDDSELGAHLIRLSSVLSVAGRCMYALLGLAYDSLQPKEWERDEINVQIPDLLESQLQIFDWVERTSWPDFARTWRELAIRRVETMERYYIDRKVNSFRSRYVEMAQVSSLIRVYEAAKPCLDSIRDHMSILYDARDTLYKYLSILENDRERELVGSSIFMLGDLINIGQEALDVERW